MPLHKAATNGNPTCLDWIIKTWKAHNLPLDIDAHDHNGRTPLFLVCHKGYLGAEALAGKSDETKKKRLECVKSLLHAGAYVNFATAKIKMTPLHWAAYQSDEEMVQLLLNHGALQI